MKHRVYLILLVVTTLVPVTADPTLAQGANLSFDTPASDDPDRPRDWEFLGTGYEVALDSIAYDAQRSLRLTKPRARGFAGIFQSLAATELHRTRIRLSGYLRARDVAGGTASLAMIIEDSAGQMLYWETMTGAMGTQEWTRYAIELPVPTEAARVKFGAQFTGSGTVWIDGLALDVVTDASIAESARAYLHHALDLMETHALRRDSIDWAAFRASAWEQARGSQTTTDLYPVFELVLRRLGDRHSHFIPPTPQASAGVQHTWPRGELTSEQVGYLRIPEFAERDPEQMVAYTDTVQGAIRTLDTIGVCGWIIDLRNNTGGNMWPMIAGLGPLLGSGISGWFVYPDGSRESWGYNDGMSFEAGEPKTRVSGEE